MGLYSMQGQPHQQQGEQTAQQQTTYSRPASVVQPQHAQTPQPQHHPGYPSASISSVYQPSGNQGTPSNQPSDGLPYYAHTPYNTPGATSGYSSAGTSVPAGTARVNVRCGRACVVFMLMHSPPSITTRAGPAERESIANPAQKHPK